MEPLWEQDPFPGMSKFAIKTRLGFHDNGIYTAKIQSIKIMVTTTGKVHGPTPSDPLRLSGAGRGVQLSIWRCIPPPSNTSRLPLQNQWPKFNFPFPKSWDKILVLDLTTVPYQALKTVESSYLPCIFTVMRFKQNWPVPFGVYTKHFILQHEESSRHFSRKSESYQDPLFELLITLYF